MKNNSGLNHPDSVMLQKCQLISNQSIKHNAVHMLSLSLTPNLFHNPNKVRIFEGFLFLPVDGVWVNLTLHHISRRTNPISIYLNTVAKQPI